MYKIEYILTGHAEKRIKERDISIEEVEKVLKDPDMTYPGRRGEVNIIKQIKSGRKIRLVYKKEKTIKIIITAIVMD